MISAMMRVLQIPISHIITDNANKRVTKFSLFVLCCGLCIASDKLFSAIARELAETLSLCST